MINTKVAAVIVTFNRKKLLIECLHAILQQSVPVDKIFVINNASTDGTEKLFEAGGEFDAKKIIICAVVHSPNFDNRYQDEEKLNHLIYEYSQRKGYEFLNLNEKIKNSRIHCFAEDKVHLNEHGYELFYKSIERGIYD